MNVTQDVTIKRNVSRVLFKDLDNYEFFILDRKDRDVLYRKVYISEGSDVNAICLNGARGPFNIAAFVLEDTEVIPIRKVVIELY
jgi:hypothetical protein